MSKKTVGIYSVAWLGGIPIAILNAFARNYFYGSYMSELSAHQVSTATGVLLIFGFYWLLNKRWAIESMKQAQVIGLVWVLLTIMFEFVFGHYIMGNTWSRLLHDYNIFEGRVWVIFLINLLVSPALIYKLEVGKGNQ